MVESSQLMDPRAEGLPGRDQEEPQVVMVEQGEG